MLNVVADAGELQAGDLTLTLDEPAREGARRMLAAALEAEVADCIERHRGERDERGHSLRGLSTGDFKGALPALLGEDAAGLSTANISRLVWGWQEEYQAFRRRDLSDRDFDYVWADGIHFRIRLEEDRLCALVMSLCPLVMIGVRPDGTKELIAIEDGSEFLPQVRAGVRSVDGTLQEREKIQPSGRPPPDSPPIHNV